MDTATIFKIIAEVGFPIAAALVAMTFVYFVVNYILESVVKAIKGMQGIIMALENRIKTMNHDIIRVDATISSALGLRPDLERIARADGKNDARRDGGDIGKKELGRGGKAEGTEGERGRAKGTRRARDIPGAYPRRRRSYLRVSFANSSMSSRATTRPAPTPQ